MKIGNSPELNAYTKLSNTRTGGADTGRTGTTGTAAGATDTAGAAVATRATGVVAEDAGSQVALSSTASTLMSSSVSGSDDSIDMDKVNRIADAIRNGEFSINAGVIADKLIANTAELLGKVQSH
ncbi:anti-sigma-28 factor, FlgM family [Roseateles sp. YR242]|uniref:flagellar biosynthesis anti-sigma factor FlgM n=1 Tax=Roseateles sp. YR242 TaxID=1855305 RepID=UPI0008B4B6E4|nr:flagellar biosynthesis anti-sigma factor FlgM [Roseateles sp. YR242]SEL44478.1 anti-sigma-28 factor, FlgM family [Roseateles sp. YR242]